MTNADFFCKKCKFDQTLSAHETGNSQARWFEAKCGKCHGRVMRYITERNKDPYLYESIKLKQEREKYRKDLIQPDHPDFKLHYRKQHEENERQKEADQEAKKKDKATRDKVWNEFGHKLEYKKPLMDLEDKLSERNSQ